MRRRPLPDPIADRRRARESVRRLQLVKDGGPDPVRLHHTLIPENHPSRIDYPRTMRMPNGSSVCLSQDAPFELGAAMTLAVYEAWGLGACGHQTCADADGHIDECRYRELEDA